MKKQFTVSLNGVAFKVLRSNPIFGIFLQECKEKQLNRDFRTFHMIHNAVRIGYGF